MNAPFTTSGTTGPKKAYVIPPEQLAYRIARKDRYRVPGWGEIRSLYLGLGGGTGDRNKQWARARGISVVVPQGTLFGTLEKLIAGCVEAAFTSSSDLLGLAIQNIDFRFKLAISTGALLLPEHSTYIRERLCDDLWVSYGCSETGPIAFGAAKETVERELGCVGRLCDDVDAKIEGGLLYVRGTSVLQQYADGTAATVNGWFRTGDRAHFTDDKLLVLEGRARA